ncbi:RDD family protein [Paraferrimonas haliotis]|uniref:RDD family protein n=1 Tax=Paraferrimonas haliotis TaxID=2013866 RepID=A0AA37X002_9GAMM|nr:RDD family protein [Paraferrimonas haliotis]GLS84381.1 RDD family protein [Paraferrimonas haliotis]
MNPISRTEELEYAGFWIRVAASLIDTILLAFLVLPLLYAFFGPQYFSLTSQGSYGMLDTLINYALPAMVIVLFWLYRSATPGKIWLGLIIVDAYSGERPSPTQLFIRYLGYYVSMLPLFAGLIWVGLDQRKQGFHDKLASTLVVRTHKKRPVNQD